MSGSNNEGRRIPHQRGTAPEVAHLVEELSPEAQRQWEFLYAHSSSVHRLAYRLTSLEKWACDDIESRVWLAVYTRLKRSGPLDLRIGRAESYLWTVTRREAYTYLMEVRERAESFIGHNLYLLDHRDNAYPSAEEQSLADLAPAMTVLRQEFSDFQLKVFVLAEGYGMKAPGIAELLGTTKDSVRDALRHGRRKLRSERVGLRLGVLADE
ncbi:sigma-70 family RNA polymerase sigma factor [Streptomyces scabiei]|uniref:sigma-70 family RNA polymerase sigma factor n=1 Tax=Streptomyces scabiei TaxID=1930 RepID=UPI00298F3E29|nr:sigma-70 family RNA polymerase sigma factor [Streptomyces scabiei]MDW8478320.1 sigma-70 family RNA polymerase sigma factor [Streptomyces scabiei]